MENFVTAVFEKTIEISKCIKNEEAILAKHWVVERTFPWLNLAKDVEISISSAEYFVMIAHSMGLIQRLIVNS